MLSLRTSNVGPVSRFNEEHSRFHPHLMEFLKNYPKLGPPIPTKEEPEPRHPPGALEIVHQSGLLTEDGYIHEGQGRARSGWGCSTERIYWGTEIVVSVPVDAQKTFTVKNIADQALVGLRNYMGDLGYQYQPWGPFHGATRSPVPLSNIGKVRQKA